MFSLSDKVLQEARRLGATVLASPSDPLRPTRAAQGCEEFEDGVAPFVQSLFAGIRWPEGFFESSHSGDTPSELLDDLFGVVLRYGGSFDPALGEVEGCDGMALCELGVVDGGNEILLLDQNDANPADPTVYLVDHHDPGQEILKLAPLSKLLAGLVPEEA